MFPPGARNSPSVHNQSVNRHTYSTLSVDLTLPVYRVSRKGLIAYASSTDCVGPITASVADAALLMNAIAGEDPTGDVTASRAPVPDYWAALEKVAQPYSPLAGVPCPSRNATEHVVVA